MQPEELSESEFIDKNEERDCDENEDIPQKVIPTRHFTSKELLEIFHNLGSANDKILVADPKLGYDDQSGTERKLTTRGRINDRREAAGAVQTALDDVFTKK